MNAPKVFTIQRWMSPLSKIQPFSTETVRLVRQNRRPNFVFGGPYGYAMTEIKTPWVETALEIKDGRKWVVWMTDAPHNALTIRDDINLMRPGTVLLGGLGLGLHLRELAKRPGFTRVVVVDNNRAVIETSRHWLPPVVDAEFIESDFYDYCRNTKMNFDNIHWDCFPADTSWEEAYPEIAYLVYLRHDLKSDCNLIFHGLPMFNIVSKT